MFIGRDYWGKNADLLNDSVLVFKTKYESEEREVNAETRKVFRREDIIYFYEWDNDSSNVVINELKQLKVFAKAPLEIDLPMLGYKLQVDLIHFSIDFEGEYLQINFNGHYFFRQKEFKNNREEKRVRKNRRLAYYNSGKHFLKSFYEQRLDENGYKIKGLGDDVLAEKGENIMSHFEYLEKCAAGSHSCWCTSETSQ